MQVVKTDAIHAALWNLDELAAVYTTPRHATNEGSSGGDMGSNGMGAAWYGGLRSVAEATELLRTGWKDGATKLQGLMDELTPPQAKSRKRKPTWSSDGDSLNIDRAMAGEWDSAWRTSKRVWTAGPQSITLVTKWGGNADKGSEALFWQGAAAAVIADALEESGYRVHVVCGTAMHGSSTSTYNRVDGAILVTLKEESEPMRLDALASLMCHAGIFRTYGFRAIEALPFAVGSTSARAWSADSRDGKGTYQQSVADAGIWPDDSVTLDEVHSRASCVAEITRVLKTFE